MHSPSSSCERHCIIVWSNNAESYRLSFTQFPSVIVPEAVGTQPLILPICEGVTRLRKIYYVIYRAGCETSRACIDVLPRFDVRSILYLNRSRHQEGSVLWRK